MVIGGAHTWIDTSIDQLPEELRRSEAWHLADTQLLEDNELMVRYCRNRPNFSQQAPINKIV